MSKSSWNVVFECVVLILYYTCGVLFISRDYYPEVKLTIDTQLLELLWVQAALFTRRALRLPPASSTQERDYAAPRGPSAECHLLSLHASTSSLASTKLGTKKCLFSVMRKLH